MLYSERPASAGRVARLANAEPLFKAWSAAIRKDAKTSDLLKAVPPDQQKAAGFHFAKALWLRKTGKLKEAAKVMAAAPSDAESLIDADAWWNERRILARSLWTLGRSSLPTGPPRCMSRNHPLMRSRPSFTPVDCPAGAEGPETGGKPFHQAA